MAESVPQCPLCISDLNETERNFYPCPCGYQICSFCFDTIINSTKLCPSCRRKYDDNAIDRVGPKYFPNKIKNENAALSAAASVCYLAPKIVQIVGIPLKIMNTGLLQGKEYLGQYGEILKLVVSRSLYPSSKQIIQSQDPSVFVKFKTKGEAKSCVYALDGYNFQGNQLQATLCVAERCPSILAGGTCLDKKHCLKIHRPIRETDIMVKAVDIEKKNVNLKKQINYDKENGYSKPAMYESYPKMACHKTVFPPPRLIPPKNNPFFHYKLYNDEKMSLYEIALSDGQLPQSQPPMMSSYWNKM